MKVYKFRALRNENDLKRIKEIIDTGKFWCSSFFELNDPMEGLFSANQERIDQIFDKKAQYKICSFSGEKAFKNPIMWGYYAAGFRGIAIEIEVKVGVLKEMIYSDQIPEKEDVEVILTNKLQNWEHEEEFRFLKVTDCDRCYVGRITGIYFGAPYLQAVNFPAIYQSSRSIRKYEEQKEKLLKFALNKRIKCWDVKISNGSVSVIE